MHAGEKYHHIKISVVNTWLNDLIIFSLKISEKWVRLFFSVCEHTTFVQKWNECNGLEVGDLSVCVLTVLWEEVCPVMNHFILTMLLKVAFLLWGPEFCLLSGPVPSPLGAAGQNWCLLPFLSDSTGCGCLQQSPWHHRDPHLIPARPAHGPPLTNGPETAFLCTDLKRTSFLVPSVCLVGLRREII